MTANNDGVRVKPHLTRGPDVSWVVSQIRRGLPSLDLNSDG